ncbi:glycosyltransferase family 4 protein [Roseivirga sp. BDSF3-8]|uniref:glycosyltransferase family 4 protein n=1 Tax=Roseivirga sp. BDSF3-8 TaxID=3241598 RepID=UPI0035325C31
MSHPKILVVVTKYPSPQHPYIIRLMAALKQTYPGLQLFMFRPGDKQAGIAQVGKEDIETVLTDALMRGQPKARPGILLNFIGNCLRNPRQAIATYKRARSQNLSTAQAIGQVFYHHELFGKQFDMVYFNAVQIAYHFDIPFYFPDTRILISCRGDDFDLNPTKYNKPLLTADHVHVLGSYLRSQVIDRGIEDKNITTIPPAFLPKWPSRENFVYSSNTLKITIAARLNWTKGHRYLLDAIDILKKSLNDTRVELHIMGIGEAEEELRYRVFELGLDKEVTFHGWVAEKEVIEMVRDSFVYCLPSLVEGYNNSVVTAQSLGVPCIVARSGGLSENVIHEKTGFVVSPASGEEIAQSILSLWEDKDLYQNMCTNAIERVKELDFSIHIRRYNQMFDEVLSTDFNKGKEQD